MRARVLVCIDTQGTFLNNSLIRSQDTCCGTLISAWGFKNRQNRGGKEQNPKSEFSNPKCESSNTPIPNQPLWDHTFSIIVAERLLINGTGNRSQKTTIAKSTRASNQTTNSQR